MAKHATTVTIIVNLADLDQEDLRDYIQKTNHVEEVFPVSELKEWAEDNGYRKDSD